MKLAQDRGETIDQYTSAVLFKKNDGYISVEHIHTASPQILSGLFLNLIPYIFCNKFLQNKYLQNARII